MGESKLSVENEIMRLTWIRLERDTVTGSYRRRER
jgi:hypothetical protein